MVALALSACDGSAQQQPAQTRALNTLTGAERAAGWRLLFDGATTNGWRNYGKQGAATGWQVVDGALTRAAAGGGDLITTEKFTNFELMLDWKISEGGNSGVFFRAIEGPAQIYFSAPEMQVLDDARHRDGQSPLTSAGSNFALHAAPRGAVRPAGEWNWARLLVNGSHVEHWLNDRKMVEYELGSPEWQQLVTNSKFKEWPEYGKAGAGHIGLQDHGDAVAFRNIKIRTLR